MGCLTFDVTVAAAQPAFTEEGNDISNVGLDDLIFSQCRI